MGRRNTSLRNLTQLTEATQNAVSVQDAGTILANTERELGTEVRTRDGDKAEFGTPEALATGIGASFILGPVGGAILGITQGLLAKKAEQNELDRIAAQESDNNIVLGAIDTAREEISSQFTEDMNPLDRAQLEGQLSDLDTAKEMITKGSDNLKAAGVQLYGSVGDRHVKWLEGQEAELIAENKYKRETDEKTFNNWRSDLTPYDTATSNSAELINRGRSIYDNMAQGDAVSVLAALSSMPLAINPAAGAMTDGEFNLWQGVGGWADGWIGKLEKELAGGGGISDPTRKLFMKEASEIIQQAEGYNAMRDGRAQGRAEINGYTPEMTAEFDSRKFIPEWSPQPFRATRGEGTDNDGTNVTTTEDEVTIETDAPSSPYQEAYRKLNQKYREQAEAEGRLPTN